jgi:monoamine oxidase
LHALFYIRSAGNLDKLISAEGGAQQDRVDGGMQPLAEALAATLGDHLHLEQPVHTVEHEGDRVTVCTPRACSCTRSAWIIAIPPTLAGRIRYEPALPAARDQLTQRAPMGSCVKCIAVYDTPFWRARGLSGQVVSDEGPIHVSFDASPPSGRPGVLMGFLEGRAARELTDAGPEERKRRVLACFERDFGPEARGYRHYVDKSWAEEEWSRGCYAAMLPPGVWTSFGHALRKPVGRIHWAGTETATEWNGYIEGALSRVSARPPRSRERSEASRRCATPSSSCGPRPCCSRRTRIAIPTKRSSSSTTRGVRARRAASCAARTARSPRWHAHTPRCFRAPSGCGAPRWAPTSAAS